MSGVKAYLESRFPRNICLGDSAFPISDVLITPYSTTESNRDRNKALFNRRLSGAWCEMTENIYGIWKWRFPIIRCLRVHLPNAYKVIVGTAVLHNFSVQWREIMPDNHPDLSLPPAIPDTSPGCCHWCTQSHKRTAEKDRRTDPRKHEKNDEWCINKNLFVLISFYLVLSIKKYSLKGKKIYFIFIQQIKFMCIVHCA